MLNIKQSFHFMIDRKTTPQKLAHKGTELKELINLIAPTRYFSNEGFESHAKPIRTWQSPEIYEKPK